MTSALCVRQGIHIDGRASSGIQLLHPAPPPTKDIAELDRGQARALKIIKHMRKLFRKID